MSWNLQNKTAIITGATKGIGLAVAEEFLQLGCTVFVIARNELRLMDCIANWKAQGYRANGIVADITDKKSYAHITDSIKAVTPTIDILVNNVGDNTPKKFLAYSEKEYLDLFNTNLFSTIEMTRLLFPLMKKNAASSVINISSVAGMVDVGTGAFYAMCKAAVQQLTRSLAVEWAGYAIRVNAVAPWFTNTDRIQKLLEDKTLEHRVLQHTPLGRIAEAKEVAGLVAFLAMEKASYINGQTIAIDGGFLANGMF